MRFRLRVAVLLAGLFLCATAAHALVYMQLPTGNPLLGVAWCRGQFVAASNYGYIETSVDGRSWLPQHPFNVPGALHSVACSDERIVIVGDQGWILTSSDGQNWTQQSDGTTQPLYAVVWSGSQFVAVGGGSAGLIFTSPDGATWTSRSNAATWPLQAVVWSGTQFVAMSRIGEALTSPDGVTWTLHPTGLPSTDTLTSLAWAPGHGFVTVGSAVVMTSPDGVTWTQRSLGAQAQLNAVTWFKGRFVATGQVPQGSYYDVFTSPDGATWTPQFAAVQNDALFAFAQSPTMLVAVGGLSGYATAISSPDADNWTLRMLGSPQGLHGVTHGAGRYVAVGDFGAIQYSSDSMTWLPAYPPTTATLLGADWSGSRYVVVGGSGTVLTSPDALTWTARTSGTTSELDGVAASQTLFVAVGISGTILTSPDGATWTARTSGTTSHLYGVTWTGTLFVAVGAGGTILTSPDAVTWTARSSSTTYDLYAVTDERTLNSNYLMAVNAHNQCVQSFDGGMTWFDGGQFVPGLSVPAYGIGWNAEQESYIVGARGYVWQDIGTWITLAYQFSGSARAVDSSGRVVVGDFGEIFTDVDLIFYDGMEVR